jgi:uncharacterized protein YyaL (SSP411 family)
MHQTFPFYEVAIVGKDYKQKLQEMNAAYTPSIMLMGGADEGTLELLANKQETGKTYIYVCQDKVCKLPVIEAKLALQQILNPKP